MTGSGDAMRRERSASSSDGMRSAPVPPMHWRQEQGQMTVTWSGQMRNSFGPLTPNPGGNLPI